MDTNRLTLPMHRDSVDPLRACAHDLRNLFAIVASAKSLLERTSDKGRQQVVVEALERVAAEGGMVTDALLAGADDRAATCEAVAALRAVTPMIKAVEHPGLRIDVHVDEGPTWIGMPSAEFRAVVLELITNAGRAGASRIRLRTLPRGRHFWVVAADDGNGFRSPLGCRSEQPAGLHGTGLRRLACAVQTARGKVRIRSRVGRGSVIAVILPAIRPAQPDGRLADSGQFHSSRR